MPVPKRRTSASKRNMRRAANDKIASLPTPVACPKCGNAQLPHQVCRSCGYYKGREVLSVPSETEE